MDDIQWNGSSFHASHTWWVWYDKLLQEGYTLTISGTVVSAGFIISQVTGKYHRTYLGDIESRTCADPYPWKAYTQSLASDVNPPLLTLNGATPFYLNQNKVFYDPGATAYDSMEGDLTDKIVTTNSVDPTTPGSYTITYDVTDTNGLAALQLSRSVIVSTPERQVTTTTQGNGTLVLDPDGGTYDDGTSVTITATPSDGYRFDYWEGDASTTTNPLAITMDGDIHVMAVFVEKGEEEEDDDDDGGGGCFISMLLD